MTSSPGQMTWRPWRPGNSGQVTILVQSAIYVPMNQRVPAQICLLIFALAASGYAQPATSGRSGHKSSWTLAWSDEFNGPDGSQPDTSGWSLESGGKGWGNQELEYYTAGQANVHLEHGHLVIAAR